MEFRPIGSLSASVAGLGCASFGWWIDEAQSRSVVHAALDAGITFFDCADGYGEGLSEEYLGRALGARRRDVTVVTKFAGAITEEGVPPGSASWVRRSCEQSLKRLGTDWIDLYMIHHPDPTTPITETLGALRDLQQAGKVREIGCSNMTPDEVAEASVEADALGITGFQAMECGYSLLDRTAEKTMVPLCQELGIPILPYFPLASGMLTGKYRRGQPKAPDGRMEKDLYGAKVKDFFPGLFTDRCFDVVEDLEKYAAAKGRSLRELALAWVVSQPWVGSVISGATSARQVEDNVTACLNWKLTEEELKDVSALTTTDYAYTWLHGAPSYSPPPPGVDVVDAARIAAMDR